MIAALAAIPAPVYTVVLVPALWALIEVRMRRVFAVQKDLNGVGKKAARAESMAQEVRDDVRVLKEAQASQALRFTEVLAEPMSKVADRLERIAEIQAEQGQSLAAQREAIKGLGKSVDDLREQVQRYSA